MGVILTDVWMPAEEHTRPFVLTVVSHYAEEHPGAPKEIQSIYDGLQFQLRGQPR